MWHTCVHCTVCGALNIKYGNTLFAVPDTHRDIQEHCMVSVHDWDACPLGGSTTCCGAYGTTQHAVGNQETDFEAAGQLASH